MKKNIKYGGIMSKENEKKLLKMKLVLLLFKEAQRLMHYEYIHRELSNRGNKLFGSENQKITPAFRAFNQELNKTICNMQKSEAKCKRYEYLILKLKNEEY